MDKINLVELSNSFQAWQSCTDKGWVEVAYGHQETIDKMLECLPSGSGLDSGVKFNWQLSKPNRLLFNTSFHHMDEHGGYDGWTDHAIVVTPRFLDGYDVKVTGRNRNLIKDYLEELFSEVFYIDYDYRKKQNT